MEGVTIIETAVFQEVLSKIDAIDKRLQVLYQDLRDTKKPYLTPHDVMEITGFGKTWLNDNKQHIGFTMIGGCLRFKRKDVEAYMEQNYFKAKSLRRTYK